MDTCSRLGEPGGVEWRDVNVVRLRTTISGKPLIWWLRAVARSDRWPRNLACAIPCCGAGWNCVGLGGSRRRRRGAIRGARAAAIYTSIKRTLKVFSPYFLVTKPAQHLGTPNSHCFEICSRPEAVSMLRLRDARQWNSLSSTLASKGDYRMYTLTDAIYQNTAGNSQGYPLGVPTSWNWYQGWNPDGQLAPPSNFASLTGGGVVYPQAGGA